MVSGDACTLPCPIRSAAPSVSEPAGGAEPKYAGKPRSWSTPSPSAAAASVSVFRSSRSRCPITAVLQELAIAVRNGIRPSADGG